MKAVENMIYGFQESKIKTYLKMGSQRLEILKNKKSTDAKLQKREVARLLSEKKVEKARIRVEHIIRDDFTIEALEIISLMCDLLYERIHYIASERKCPEELEEAVSTLIWVSDRLDISELHEIKNQLSMKYGRKFTSLAEQNSPLTKVNIRIVKKLKLDPPDRDIINAYLQAIAEEYNVDWVPAQV